MRAGRKLNSVEFQEGVKFMRTFAKSPLRILKVSLRAHYRNCYKKKFSDLEWNVEFGMLMHEALRNPKRAYVSEDTSTEREYFVAEA